MQRKTIKTSDPDWFKNALECYRNGEAFELIDDAGLGVSQADLGSGVRLVAAGRRRYGVPVRQIAQVLAGLGVSALGMGLVMLAIADPDPTSKLGLLVGGGVALVMTGSLSVLWSLKIRWQVDLRPGGDDGPNLTVSPA